MRNGSYILQHITNKLASPIKLIDIHRDPSLHQTGSVVPYSDEVVGVGEGRRRGEVGERGRGGGW